jgi:hypothetical protein
MERSTRIGSVLISSQEAFNRKVRQENREAREEKNEITTLPRR